MQIVCTAILLTFWSLSLWAQGGPPMVTDDPGTPGDGHWEINIATLYAATSEQKVLQAPYFDLNYGWGEHIQLKLETGWVNDWQTASRIQTGAGTALAGVKYRFLDEDKAGFSASTYPQIQFKHFFSSHDPEIASPGNQYLLPFELSKSFGSWELNPEIGYLYGTKVASEIFYGLVVAFEKAKPLEPLMEIHVNTPIQGRGSTTLLNLGSRYSLNKEMNLLLALGHTVTTSYGEKPELDAYLGLQLEL